MGLYKNRHFLYTKPTIRPITMGGTAAAADPLVILLWADLSKDKYRMVRQAHHKRDYTHKYL